jgi:hypothetical protein
MANKPKTENEAINEFLCSVAVFATQLSKFDRQELQCIIARFKKNRKKLKQK